MLAVISLASGKLKCSIIMAAAAPHAVADCFGACLQMAEMKLKVDNVERERDFYFDKLRDIEILCQMAELQSVPVSQAVCAHRAHVPSHIFSWKAFGAVIKPSTKRSHASCHAV